MDKIKIVCFLLFCICTSCDDTADQFNYDQFLAEGYNLEFDEFPRSGVFNLAEDSIKFDSFTKKIKNVKLSLTITEKNQIAKELKNQGLLNIKGEIELPLGKIIAPVFKDYIFLYKEKTLIAKISIPSHNTEKIHFGQKRKIQNFYLNLKKILQKNINYAAKQKEIIKHRKKNLELFL